MHDEDMGSRYKRCSERPSRVKLAAAQRYVYICSVLWVGRGEKGGL